VSKNAEFFKTGITLSDYLGRNKKKIKITIFGSNYLRFWLIFIRSYTYFHRREHREAINNFVILNEVKNLTCPHSCFLKENVGNQ